jgi:hypothetical protein
MENFTDTDLVDIANALLFSANEQSDDADRDHFRTLANKVLDLRKKA